MSKFLQEVASYIATNQKSKLADLKIIFPNRRSGLFFQQYLIEELNHATFLPEITTISEFIAQQSSLQALDRQLLIIELHQVFTEVLQSDETLDEFYFWGEILLSDFNDIDKYLIDAKQLFQNIESLKEIDASFEFISDDLKGFLSSFWDHILNSKTSENKEYFLNIWKNLHEIYITFQKQLREKNRAYEGMIYREVIEQLKNKGYNFGNEEISLVGFNALNECEYKLFKILAKNVSTNFYWDYDEFYMNIEAHEANMFMKRNINVFPMPKEFAFSSNNFSNLKEIDVVAVPGFTGQANYAANWISNLGDQLQPKYDNTAIVLCDETLLPSVLNEIPEKVKKLNITMGFPLKGSPALNFIKSIIELNAQQRTDENGKIQFYYQNILSMLSQSLLYPILKSTVAEFTKMIKDENRIYLSEDDFKKLPVLSVITNLPQKSNGIRDYLQKIIKMVFNQLSENDQLNKETLYQIHLEINKLHDSLFADEKNKELISVKLFHKILLRQIERISIPFEGEPLAGVQIMGFLETRSLDFDNVILLSATDDKIPGSGNRHSFIPYNLRRGFSLPVADHHQAMYAYYFYRLIQRAKNVTIVYDSRTEGMTRGEVTRYATQLQYEASHVNINHQQAVYDFSPTKIEEITIPKTHEIIQGLINKLSKKTISPSALNTYLDCSLKFYFKYYEQLYETEDIVEDFDNLMFGRIAHVALEEIYKEYTNKILSKETIQGIIKNQKLIEKSLNIALEQEYFKGKKFKLSGKNLMVHDIIKKYVLKVLQLDKAYAPFSILGLEDKYTKVVQVEVNGKTLDFEFGGTIDRLDEKNGRIRVVDYKTGKSSNIVKSIPSMFFDNANRNKAAFQTMLYAGCVAQKYDGQTIVPSVFGARSIFMPDFSSEFVYNDTTLTYHQFENEYNEELKNLLQEILNPEIPFQQVKSSNACKYCPYQTICNRKVPDF